MRCFALITLAATLLFSATAPASTHAPRKTLTAFTSEQELAELINKWTDAERRRREELSRARAGQLVAPSAPAPSAAPMAAAKAQSNEAAAAESVTNVQHAGVDEGGIVKLHGDHLVILRRGRLFTVRVGDGSLRPVASVDAFGDGIDPRGAWYDEMLLAGNSIAVIGYSYARGGTEVGVFDIDRSGGLRYRATWHLRSNDYYSSRNYASRLIGSKLVLYSPLYLNLWGNDPFAMFPAVRKWRPGATPADFKRIAPATRIYRTDELDPQQGVALHSVTICDLAKPDLDCESSAVMGPPGRVFYVSPDAVFVWASAWRPRASSGRSESGLFRIPLDGSPPSMLKVSGSPIDQFSFMQSDDGMLSVLVRSSGRGDGMWAAELSSGDLALLRVPLSSFSDGRDAAPPSAYRALPKPAEGGALQNRYIGAHLLYGVGTGWGRPQPGARGTLYALRYAAFDAIHEVQLPHAIDRIEALGSDSLVAGSDGRDLHLSSLRLGREPVLVSRYTRMDAAQGETRSHGFFYRPESENEGLLGLPIIAGGTAASQQLRKTSAAILFLRNQQLTLGEVGELAADPSAANVNDGCRASCVDWYGNARPLFVRGRIFALMGYEIVEGRLVGGRIVERQRVNYAPKELAVAR